MVTIDMIRVFSGYGNSRVVTVAKLYVTDCDRGVSGEAGVTSRRCSDTQAVASATLTVMVPCLTLKKSLSAGRRSLLFAIMIHVCGTDISHFLCD